MEEGILKFGSSLEEAASLKRNISLSQQIPLGGGDILLNSVKSGGALQVQQEDEPYLWIFIDYDSYPLYLVNVSSWTVDNFWVDQGYIWQYGYVNVSRTSGSGDGTPLHYATMDDVWENLVDSPFGETLIEIDDDGSDITIEAVNFTTDDQWFSSGNGIGELRLDARKEKRNWTLANVSFGITLGTDLAANFQNQSEITKVYPQRNVTLILTTIRVSAY